MKDLLAHHAKFVVDWGQPILIVVIVLGLGAILLIGRRNRFFVPRGIVAWIGAIITLCLVAMSGLLLVVLSIESPRTGVILQRFENLRGRPAPELAFRLLADDSVRSVGGYADGVALVNVWATWCPPCLREMPAFERLQRDYQDRGLTVIALSDEPRDVVARYAEKHPSSLAYGYVQEFDWAGTDLGSVRPVTFLLDRHGIILDYYTGAYEYEFYAEKIDKVLNR